MSSLCPEEDLKENGIKITGHIPKRLPILKYPKFPDDCKSLLQKYLTEALWRELRPITTKYEGRLSNCIVAGVEDPSLPIGIYACDGDAYIKFRSLFEPIITELHEYDMKSAVVVRHNYDISALEWKKLEKVKQIGRAHV